MNDAKYRGVEQLVARRAHNPEVVGSNPSPATICEIGSTESKLRHRFENNPDLQPLVVRSARGTPHDTTQIVWRRSLVGYSGRFIPGRSLVRIRSPLPYGSLAQLVRASALQAGGHRFESCSFHHLNSNKCKYGPMVKWSKTSPFHGGNPSSNLGRVTILKKYELLVRIFFMPCRGLDIIISTRLACRTRDTRLTFHYANKFARSTITAVANRAAYEPR